MPRRNKGQRLAQQPLCLAQVALPQRPAVPTIDVPVLKSWPQNPIDSFVLRRLLQEGLQPSPEADRLTLARRVYLDLIGLPPTPEEADAFAGDEDPRAYEKLVDRVLRP